MASAPSLIETAGGKKLMSEAPKDGYLYGVDLAENAVIYRVPVTKIENVDAPFPRQGQCIFAPARPAGRSGTGRPMIRETNLILTGEIEWCTTVKLQTEQQLRDVITAAYGSGWRAKPIRYLGQTR